MLGEKYWSTGITVVWSNDLTQITAKCEFFDDGFGQHESTLGELRLRYYVNNIENAIDTLRTDAERPGIEWRPLDDGPCLYVQDDGTSPDIPLPANWRELLYLQAKRIGWNTLDRFVGSE